MKQQGGFLVLALILVGCGAGATDPATPAGAAPAASSGVASPTRHLGEWVMAPPPGQERELALVRWALATPPDERAFAATHPSADERELFDNIQRVRREHPDSPTLESLQRKLDQLQGVRITFLPGKFITSTPSGIGSTAYRIDEDLGDRMVLLEEGSASESSRRRMLSFDGADRMVVTVGPTRIPMVRVAPGTVPPPNEVPSAPRPSAHVASTRTPSVTVRPSGNVEYDTCVADYYRCIDQMKPADREAMSAVIAQTKQIFAEAPRDPESMRSALASCKQAVQLAHATFCH